MRWLHAPGCVGVFNWKIRSWCYLNWKLKIGKLMTLVGNKIIRDVWLFGESCMNFCLFKRIIFCLFWQWHFLGCEIPSESERVRERDSWNFWASFFQVVLWHKRFMKLNPGRWRGSPRIYCFKERIFEEREIIICGNKIYATSQSGDA